MSVPPIGDLTTRHSKPRLPPSSAYYGDPKSCRSFLAKCSLFFALQPSAFLSEGSKVALVNTLLTGRAAQWGWHVPRWAEEGVWQCCLWKRYRCWQSNKGNQSVFRTLAAQCNWNEEAPWDMFLHGLADRIQNESYALEIPSALDDLIELSHPCASWHTIRKHKRHRYKREQKLFWLKICTDK